MIREDVFYAIASLCLQLSDSMRLFPYKCLYLPLILAISSLSLSVSPLSHSP